MMKFIFIFGPALLELEGKWAWPPRALLMVWGLQTRPKSWPIIVGGQIKIVYPRDVARIENYLAVTRLFLEKFQKPKHSQSRLFKSVRWYSVYHNLPKYDRVMANCFSVRATSHG